MKLSIIFVSCFVILFVIFSTIPIADGASVSLPSGSSVPGCEEVNRCFIPYTISISRGETVTWSNDDSAAHTVTSGSATDGPSGVFDSSLFMAGTTFSVTFTQSGNYDYFCMVHPWMVGVIQVAGSSGGMSSSTPSAPSISSTKQFTFYDTYLSLQIKDGLYFVKGSDVLVSSGIDAFIL